jgi:hypothetical protein
LRNKAIPVAVNGSNFGETIISKYKRVIYELKNKNNNIIGFSMEGKFTRSNSVLLWMRFKIHHYVAALNLQPTHDNQQSTTMNDI